MSENSEFNLDELKVDAEEIYPPIALATSVLVSRTEFSKEQSDIEDIKRKIQHRIKEKYAFKEPEIRTFKEGFLAFRDTQKNTLECLFAKETPTKISFEANDLEIHEQRLRLISPSYSVKVRIHLDKNGAEVILSGGSDLMIKRAMDCINYSIRHCIIGGHKTLTPGFTKLEMTTILRNFGLNVEYIWIHPGESEKFMKVVEKKIAGEVKMVPEYIVHARLRGYHITGSPITIRLIEESGINLREIQGQFEVRIKKNVTARVSSTGKILFYIPLDLVGKKQTVLDVSEQLYKRIITQRLGPKQTTMGEYLVDES